MKNINLELTQKEIIELAKLERDMDSGKAPYVVNRGNWSQFDQDILDKFGIVSGQTVSDMFLLEIMTANIDELEKKRKESNQQ